MMKDYIFLAAILLLRFPQSYFNKKTSGMVNGAAAYFLYGAYSYLLAGGAALILLLAEGVGGASACPHSASRRSARFRSR